MNAFCLRCGENFRTFPSRLRSGRGRYCSHSCSATANRKGKPAPWVRHNLDAFNARRRSGEVYVRPWNKQEPVEMHCEVCGKGVVVRPSRSLTLRCCSLACAHKLKSFTVGPAHPLWRQVERTCEMCGTVFLAKPAKVRIGEARFCSRRCVGGFIVAKIRRGSSLEDAVALLLPSEIFERQKALGPWVVDFYVPGKNLVIECDGKYWHSQPKVVKRDRQKTGWILRNGYHLLRLSEDEIRNGQAALSLTTTLSKYAGAASQ